MSLIYLKNVPLHVRLEYARFLIQTGDDDPAALLEAAISPGDFSAPCGDEMPVSRYQELPKICSKGHVLEGDNIVLVPRKREKGREPRKDELAPIVRCRTCRREFDRQRYLAKAGRTS